MRKDNVQKFGLALFLGSAVLLAHGAPIAQAAVSRQVNEWGIMRSPQPASISIPAAASNNGKRRAVRSPGPAVTLYYLDSDHDGYGDPSSGIPTNEPGRILNGSDCNDHDLYTWQTVANLVADPDMDGLSSDRPISACVGRVTPYAGRTYYNLPGARLPCGNGAWFIPKSQVLGPDNDPCGTAS